MNCSISWDILGCRKGHNFFNINADGRSIAAISDKAENLNTLPEIPQRYFGLLIAQMTANRLIPKGIIYDDVQPPALR